MKSACKWIVLIWGSARKMSFLSIPLSTCIVLNLFRFYFSSLTFEQVAQFILKRIPLLVSFNSFYK